MGLPSPALDYVERRLTPEDVMGITALSVVIQATKGYAVAEPGVPAKMGSMVLLELSGRLVFGQVGAKRFLTNDGIIEGDALDDAKVIGVVTHLVKSF